MNYKKYLIWAPDFSRTSGGTFVLHKLCHLLNEAGHQAYVSGRPRPHWNEMYADSSKIKELISEDAITIYPDIVLGNPFNARLVVRYVLNKPGRAGGAKTYDKHEIFFCYAAAHEKYVDQSAGILEIPSAEPELFNNDSSALRSGTLFYVGKCKKASRIKETESATEITAAYPPTREELANLFKKSELMYSYDNLTALIQEARLCGCPVVVIPDSDYSKEEVIGFFSNAGLSYGLADIEHAKRTVHEYAGVYKDQIKKNFDLDNFIKKTQELCEFARGYPEIDRVLGHLFNCYGGIEDLTDKEVESKEKYLLLNLHRVFLDPRRIFLFLVVLYLRTRYQFLKRKKMIHKSKELTVRFYHSQLKELPKDLVRKLLKKVWRKECWPQRTISNTEINSRKIHSQNT